MRFGQQTAKEIGLDLLKYYGYALTIGISVVDLVKWLERFRKYLAAREASR